MGAGAVGSYFGGRLALAGAPVTLIGRPDHVAAINRDGLFLDSLHFQGAVPLAASTDPEAASSADLILLCVKTLDTVTAVQALAPFLRPDATLLSLQNGVDNVDRIRAEVGIDAIPAVVYVAAEMAGPGRVRHTGRGDLLIGDLPNRPATTSAAHDRLTEIAATFSRAGIPCQITPNIQGMLWVKMIMNSAYNGISALSRARYGPIAANRWTRAVMIQVVEEAIAVARAIGVQLPELDLVEAALALGGSMGAALSSTAQDVARGKLTEIDSFNGYLARQGEAAGVATPVNQTIHALVKLLEEAKGS
jgi:2-dehydropantoate 2-reductase